jgi:hypothetical protein
MVNLDRRACQQRHAKESALINANNIVYDDRNDRRG